MAAQSCGFRAVWKRKRPAPSLLVYRLRRSSKFLQAWTQETMMVNVTIFFFFDFWGSFKCIVIYQLFDGALLLWSLSWQLPRNVPFAMILIHSYRRSLDKDERSLVGTPRSSFTAILRAVWSFFFHQANPSLVSSPIQSPPSFPAPSLSTGRNHSLLDHRRHESHQTYSSYQLVSHLETSTTLFPAIWTKTAGKQRWTIFSMNKTRESKQQSTNWRRKHLGDMQQQSRRCTWPGFDKSVETKLRLDVYIRPWPPGWSFLRRIYTSRGSERVKLLSLPK